jgi:hypothetical protein
MMKQRFAMTASLSPSSLPEGRPLLNPLPQAGEEANVKGACFDLRDEVSLREFHVTQTALLNKTYNQTLSRTYVNSRGDLEMHAG